MKRNLLISFISILTLLNNCTINSSNKKIEGTWVGAYIHFPADTILHKDQLNKLPLENLIDISSDRLIIKSYEDYNASQKSYKYSFKDSLIILKMDSTNDTLIVVSISNDSLVVKNPNWKEKFALYKKNKINNSQVPDLSSKMYQISYEDVIDTLEFTNDTMVFPNNLHSITTYHWDKYKDIIYLKLFGNWNPPLFLDSTNGKTIFLNSYYTNLNVKLTEINDYQKENLENLYGDWIGAKITYNGRVMPSPPLMPGLTYEDTIRKLTITKDSMCLKYYGKNRCRSWSSNMTNKFIYFSKQIDDVNTWEVVNLNDSSLILKMGKGPEVVTFKKVNKKT